MIINRDCRYFKGDVPCVFHKQKGLHCSDCPHYEKIQMKILIIKLGAIGDVIRSTPLLTTIKKVYPSAEIFWLTYYPDIVPDIVDHVLRMDMANIIYLQAIEFDIIYNLDKDKEACALTSLISAKIKKGFILKDNKAAPIDEDAIHKFNTGLFDDVNKNNKKTYIEEIFEICGFTFEGQRYILPKINSNHKFSIAEPRPLIGLNTGCGSRWQTRLWAYENWVNLSTKLKDMGYGVLLLGGEQEHEKNKEIASLSQALYLGYFPLNDFLGLIDQCNLIVTGVTMTLHIAIGLNKKIVLFNNIFNKNEFELYGLGKIIEPELDCLGCFKSQCQKNCMELITVDKVLENCQDLLKL
jgi:ADP-heptose:LPS heptosyltransferase